MIDNQLVFLYHSAMKQIIRLKGRTRSPEFRFNLQRACMQIDYPSHLHDFTELVIIEGGRAVHYVEDKQFPIQAGDVFVIHLGVHHGFEQVENLSIINIMFDLHQLGQRWQELWSLAGFQSLFILEPYYRQQHVFQSHLTLQPWQLQQTQAMVTTLEDEYRQQIPGWQLLIEVHFASLIGYLCRQVSSRRNSATRKIQPIAEAVAHLERNFTQTLTTPELAAKANLSARHFVRVFKAAYGVTPTEYTLTLRLNLAMTLLEHSDKSIGEIAEECGFYDSSNFFHQFKKRAGIGPRQYRLNLEKEKDT